MEDSYKILAPFFQVDMNGVERFTACLIDIHPSIIVFAQATHDGATFIEFLGGKTAKVGIPFWNFVTLQSKLDRIDVTYKEETELAYKERYKNVKDK